MTALAKLLDPLLSGLLPQEVLLHTTEPITE